MTGMTAEGVSAIVASAALIGVALSLAFQSRQLRLMRIQSVHMMQFELERMVVADPAIYPSHLHRNDPEEIKRGCFLMMWIKYIEMGYQIGHFDDKAVRSNAEMVFGDPAFRDYWRLIRSRHASSARNSRQKHFFSILDESVNSLGPGADEAAHASAGEGDSAK
jgi:hypothetical protein